MTKFQIEWNRIDWSLTQITQAFYAPQIPGNIIPLMVVNSKDPEVKLRPNYPLDDTTYATILPPLEKNEIYDLEKSLLKEGQRNPIIVWDGKIVAGIHRYRLLKKHNKEIKAVFYQFDDDTECRLWIQRDGRQSRTLNKAQRIESVLQFEPVIESIAKLNQNHHQIKDEYIELLPKSAIVQIKKGKVHTREILAKMAKVGNGTFSDYKQILKFIDDEKDKAIKQKFECLKDKVIHGKMTINKLFTKVEEEQNKQQRIQNMANASKSGNYTAKLTLYHGDFREVMTAKIRDQSVNVIITDPLYNIKLFTPQDMEDLAQQSARVLKDDGALVMVHEVANLPEIMERMTTHLDFYWLLIDPKTEFVNEINGSIDGQTVKVHNSDMRNDVNLLHGYKPIYVFVKKKKKTNLATRLKDIAYEQNKRKTLYEDVLWNTKAPPKDKIHQFEQSREMIEYLFNMFTKWGDVVLDMFAGGGTTLSVGSKPQHNLKEIIGIDKDESVVKDMEQTLNIPTDECFIPDCPLHHPQITENNNPITSEGVTID